MGRVISGTVGTKTPLVQLRTKGVVFVGTKIGQKEGKKGGFIFEAAIADGTTADTVLATGEKNAEGKNIYAVCEVDLGDTVTIFGDTQLNDKLAKVETGETFKITANGKLQNPKTGNWFNDYLVEVL